MGKPQPFEISLSCDHWLAPGCDWSAFVGFRPTRDGFSVWASGSTGYDDSRYNQRIAHIKGKEVTWRNACRALLDMEVGAIFGDFRGEVDVDGVEGWQAEMLEICWIQEDSVPNGVKEYLLGLSDEDIEWLIPVIGGDLFSDSALELLDRFTAVETRSPRVCWDESELSGEQGFDALVEQLEQNDEDQRDSRMAPFLEGISAIVESTRASWGNPTSWAGGMASAMKAQRLRGAVCRIVEEHGRLPTDEELQRITSRL